MDSSSAAPCKRWISGWPPAVARICSLAGLCAIALRAGGAQSATDPPPPLRGLDAYIERTMQEWGVPGIAIAVVKDDAVVWARGFGTRTLGTNEPVTPRTMFAIGSSTKAFTATALATLVDQRKLAWDTRVASALPGFALSDSVATRLVTVRDLLSHRTGMPGENLLFWGTSYGRDEVMRRLRWLPMRASPRTHFEYSNLGYLVAGQVVAAIGGRRWDDVVSERIFAPLGMTRSITNVAALSRFDDVATPHAMVDGALRPVPLLDLDNAAPAGAIVSTVLDLAQWLRLNLGDGTYRGRRIVSDSAMREMHAPQMSIPASFELVAAFPDAELLDYGLGWYVHDYHGHRVIEHGGQTDGMHGEVALLPDQRVGVVVLTNAVLFGYPMAIAYRVIDAYLGRAERDWSGEFARNFAWMNGGGRARGPVPERAPDPTHSLPLDRYVGRYRHPMYGDADVRLSGDTLVLSVLGRRATLVPWQRDGFRIGWAPWEGMLRGMAPLATFEIVSGGRVRSVRLGAAGVFSSGSESSGLR